jgi:hypothetical protein
MERPDDSLDIGFGLNQGEFGPLIPAPLNQDMKLVPLHLPAFGAATVIATAVLAAQLVLGRVAPEPAALT